MKRVVHFEYDHPDDVPPRTARAAFVFACMTGNTTFVEDFKDIITDTEILQRGFLDACAHGHLSIVQLLQAYFDVSLVLGLNEAATYGHLNVFGYLLNHGVEMTSSTIQSAFRGGNMQIIQLLNIPQNYDMNDVFAYACRSNKLDVVKYAANLGANNWCDGIYVSCETGNVDILRFLIEKVGSPASPSTYMMLAAGHKHARIAYFFMTHGGCCDLSSNFITDTTRYGIYRLTKNKDKVLSLMNVPALDYIQRMNRVKDAIRFTNKERIFDYVYPSHK